MKQLVRALEGLMTPPSRTVFKAPTFNGEGGVKLFLEQFKDVVDADEWTDREALLHLKSRLQRPTQVY